MGQPGGLALRRAVEVPLDPADPETSPVVPAHPRIVRQPLAGRPVVRVGDHIDVELAGLRHRRVDREVGGEGPTLGGGREAEARVRIDPHPDHVPLPVLAEVREHREDREHRRLLQHAVGLARAGAASDHSARGILGGGRDPRHLEQLRVHAVQVPGLVNDEDRAVGGHLVEVVPCRVPALGELRVVVAEADDPAEGLRGLSLAPGPELLLESFDRVDVRVGRGQQVRRQRLESDVLEVPVRVDEARQHRVRAELDDLGVVAPVRHHRVLAPDREDPAVLHGHGLGARLRVVHGHDVADVDGLCRVAGARVVRSVRGAACRHPSECGDRHHANRDRPCLSLHVPASSWATSSTTDPVVGAIGRFLRPTSRYRTEAPPPSHRSSFTSALPMPEA